MLKNIYRKIVKALLEDEISNYYDEEVIEEITSITELQNSLVID